MNDLGHGQLLNLNWLLQLVLLREENHWESYNISITLAKDFITSHSLSQSS